MTEQTALRSAGRFPGQRSAKGFKYIVVFGTIDNKWRFYTKV